MAELIPVEQVEQLVAQQVVPLREALALAKRTIAMLQTKLYGVRGRDQPGGAVC